MASKGETGGDGGTGLTNLHNTCYISSVLQALSHTVPLRTFLIELSLELLQLDGSPEQRWLTFHLALIVRQLWSNKFSSLWPVHFRRRVGIIHSQFASNYQQDAMEMMTVLLERLHDDVNQPDYQIYSAVSAELPLGATIHEKAAHSMAMHISRTGVSIISELFGHRIVDQVTCGNPYCLQRRPKFNPDNFFVLPVQQRSSDTLTNLLDIFIADERTDCPIYCDFCGESTVSKRNGYFWDLPEILVIQLSRAQVIFKPNKSPENIKLSHMIEYPITGLDMSKYCHPENKSTDSSIYDLYAVIKHLGNDFSSGHYITVARVSEGASGRVKSDPFGSTIAFDWYVLNDHSVLPARESDIKCAEAYVLFYRRRHFRRETV